ncbi:hypothetical protein Trydic_g20346 [Trypoxylus dichotomus]
MSIRALSIAAEGTAVNVGHNEKKDGTPIGYLYEFLQIPLHTLAVVGQHIMDHDAQSHEAMMMKNFRYTKDGWPINSPDANSMEHSLDVLGRRISARKSATEIASRTMN